MIHSDIYHLCADVGPWWPQGFPHHRQRGRGDDITGVDAEQTLQSIHTNFVRLTHRIPMAQVKELPEDSPAESPILLRREIPMAWGTTTNSLTPEINPF